MPVLLAARKTDEIAHSFEIIGKIVGTVLGACAAVVMVKASIAATVATYGIGAPLIPLAVGFAGMGISAGGKGGGRLVRGLETMIFGGPLTTGSIITGSSDVKIEKLPAARTVIDITKCNGKYFLFHPPMPLFGPGPTPRIAQGAKTVFINDQNAARQTMLIECGAKIKTACKTVYFGGETANQLFTLEGYLDIALDFIGEISATFTRFLFKLYVAALMSSFPLFGPFGLILGPLAWKYDLGGKLFDGIGYVIGSALDGLAKWGDGIHPGLGDVLAGGAELFMASAPLIRMPTFIKGPWEALKSKAWGKGASVAPEIKISDAQFGKKIGKHAEDFGLDPSDPVARSTMKTKIEDITQNPTEIRQGDWNAHRHGGGNDYFFFRQGNDVVIAKPDGTFVTILKDGATNRQFQGAKTVFPVTTQTTRPMVLPPIVPEEE